MKKTALLATAVLVVFGASFAPLGAQNHVIQAVKDAQWGPAPPFIPPGAELSVLSGDPSKPAPYSVRLKFPAHYAIAAHSHPTDENVVIVSGNLTFGMGDKLVKAAKDNRTLASGGYALMPAGMNHFAYTSGGPATIVLYGIGPVEFKYVNPADDPRNVKHAAK